MKIRMWVVLLYTYIWLPWSLLLLLLWLWCEDIMVIGVVLCCEPGARNCGLVFDNDWCYSSLGNILSCYVGHCLSFHWYDLVSEHVTHKFCSWYIVHEQCNNVQMTTIWGAKIWFSWMPHHKWCKFVKEYEKQLPKEFQVVKGLV